MVAPKTNNEMRLFNGFTPALPTELIDRPLGDRIRLGHAFKNVQCFLLPVPASVVISRR
jgi:hypothetical protein